MTLPEPDATNVTAIAAQYARRNAVVDAQRYSLFDAASLQAHQERQRAVVDLWRDLGRGSLGECIIVEVGCGAGGNMLDLLRLGADPKRMRGIELQAERASAARCCLPATVGILEGDAAVASIEPASLDIVLSFTVFSSILDASQQSRLAAAMWRWLRPGGGVLWYDFAFDNPRNPDVRGVPVQRVRTLFPDARLTVRRLTLAPPISRALAGMHPALVAPVAATLPFLKTHRLVWAQKS